MRLTIVILLAIFGLILCVNLSASTYMDWQRFRNDRAPSHVIEYLDARRQRAFDNCVKLSLAYPRVGDTNMPYPRQDWLSLIQLCESYRKAVP